MSRIVAGLRGSRLIAIKADPRDARRMRIRATGKGMALLQKAREVRIADLAEHLERTSEEELDTLHRAVEILRRILEIW